MVLHRYQCNPRTQGYMLGLCEGNYCKGGSEGRERGNGRLVVFTYRDLPHNVTVGSKHHTCEYVSTACRLSILMYMRRTCDMGHTP